MSLTIKPGQYYRTRGGHKAYVSSVNTDCPFSNVQQFPYPVRGWLAPDTEHDEARPLTWDTNGTYNRGHGGNNRYDLVAEWVAELVKPVIVYRIQYSNTMTTWIPNATFATFAEAEANAKAYGITYKIFTQELTYVES